VTSGIPLLLSSQQEAGTPVAREDRRDDGSP
jgi:hypothetical protein